LKHDWDTLLPEQALMERYHLTDRQLADLRARGMPYIAVSLATRLYEEAATLDWLGRLERVAERRPRIRKPKEAH
jgi:hypothetical protein